MEPRKTKVLIIDDSILVRKVLSDIINEAPDMEVIGVASDPYEARELIKKDRPDVITLDVEMPRMDGLTFLDKLMRAIPIPVIMISSLTQENADTTLKALELGAVDYIAKPTKGIYGGLDGIAEDILEKIRIARIVPRHLIEKHKFREKQVFNSERRLDSQELEIIKRSTRFSKLFPLIAIGASTGGTVALEKLLKLLNYEVIPPIVIVQHIPPYFSKSLADRLNSLLPFTVLEGVNGYEMKKGDVIIAPGGFHMMIEKTISGYKTIVKDGPKVNSHKPSVDVLFKSVANVAKDSAIGIILTGMGGDGAKGMVEMKQKNAFNIGQNKDSCAVYGMPRVAFELNAVDIQLSLEGMADYLNRIFEGNF